MRKLTSKDFKQLENIITKQKQPIFIENKYGKFALLLTDAGKIKFLNKGYIAIKLDEFKTWLKDCKTVKEQKEVIDKMHKSLSEGFEVANKVKEMFNGEIRNLEGIFQ